MKVTAYDSAYPGSMSVKPDGGYIDRTDEVSLAAALLGRITSLQRQVEDLADALAIEKADHKRTSALLRDWSPA